MQNMNRRVVWMCRTRDGRVQNAFLMRNRFRIKFRCVLDVFLSHQERTENSNWTPTEHVNCGRIKNTEHTQDTLNMFSMLPWLHLNTFKTIHQSKYVLRFSFDHYCEHILWTRHVFCTYLWRFWWWHVEYTNLSRLYTDLITDIWHHAILHRY